MRNGTAIDRTSIEGSSIDDCTPIDKFGSRENSFMSSLEYLGVKPEIKRGPSRNTATSQVKESAASMSTLNLLSDGRCSPT